MIDNIKHSAKTQRDRLQQGIYRIINPPVRAMIKLGVTPNMVTTVGMLGNLVGAAFLVWAGTIAAGGGDPFTVFTWGGVLIIAFSLFDMLDGQVARLGNMASTFGAMYDSVLDRYCEMFNLGGLAFYLIQRGEMWGALITFLAMMGSLMVSYVRARAEGLDIECKIGFMQRPERVVVTAVGVIATGITGLSLKAGATFNPDVIIIVAMAIIAVFANMTAFARIDHCRKALNNRPK